MTDQEILTLVRGNESDRVERKEALSDKVRRAICAFANDLAGHHRPGLVVIGQRDDGTCANLAINDQLLTTLAGIRVESAFAPFPAIDVRAITVDGCELAVMVVHVATSPPVRYDGRTFVRVGPSTRVATPEEEQRLSERRRAAHLPFDVQAVAGAKLTDLDLDRFRKEYLPNAVAPEVLEENHRELVQQLAALRMVTPDGEPTVVGTLVLANDPLRFLPGAYIQFVRFDGRDLSDPIVAQHRISGPLQQQLVRLNDLIEANIRTSLEVTGRTHSCHAPRLSRRCVASGDQKRGHAPRIRRHVRTGQGELVHRPDRGVEPRWTLRASHHRAVRLSWSDRLPESTHCGGAQGTGVRRTIRRRPRDREQASRFQWQSSIGV